LKSRLEALIGSAVQTLIDNQSLPGDLAPKIQITRGKDPQHGDFSCNIALMLAKAAKTNPRVLAESLVAVLAGADEIEKVEIAGPGFINFFVARENIASIVGQIVESGDQYGRSNIGRGRKLQVEFVSANPTGPLHVGHGRHAAYGATLANLLEAVGYDVQREYYVNDAGRQMDILATSVWLRYLELGGEEFVFPANGYRGDYIYDIAAILRNAENQRFDKSSAELLTGVPADEPDGGDKEAHIDGLIARAKATLGDSDYRLIHDLALNTILEDIRDDLTLFGARIDRFFSEQSMMDSGEIERALQRLETSGYLYEEGGAIWFRSTDFGDEKDRVVKRDNGQTTYFTSDIGYVLNKLERGFETAIYVWGADHHGYVARIKAVVRALGEDPSRIEIPLVQFAILYKNKQKVQMSTRSGEFVTLRQLRKEVGSDAARFFFVNRRCEQHLDFDLDLAVSKSNENPMYYIQYAHARICSVMRQAAQKNLELDRGNGLIHQLLLASEQEQKIASELNRFPEVVEKAAINREPHLLVNYLRELATVFHGWYNAEQFIVDEKNIRDARLLRCLAVRQVIANGLGIIGVSAPEEM
jgi:arginyl-tRNA synthetase